jgi:hypothetical protein
LWRSCRRRAKDNFQTTPPRCPRGDARARRLQREMRRCSPAMRRALGVRLACGEERERKRRPRTSSEEKSDGNQETGEGVQDTRRPCTCCGRAERRFSPGRGGGGELRRRGRGAEQALTGPSPWRRSSTRQSRRPRGGQRRRPRARAPSPTGRQSPRVCWNHGSWAVWAGDQSVFRAAGPWKILPRRGTEFWQF